MQPLQTTALNAANSDVEGENVASVNSSEESVSLVQCTDDGPPKISDLGDEHTHFVISRKTSTASECTTMSDYTPENTITSNSTLSPPTISMMQQQQMQQQHLPIRPETIALIPVEQGVDGGATDIDQSTPTGVESNLIVNTTSVTKDVEAASPTNKSSVGSQPVRKISRFLVSPAILTVTNEKLSSPQMTPTEEKTIEQYPLIMSTPASQPPLAMTHEQMMAQQMVMEIERQRLGENINIMNASEILSVNPQLSGKIAEFMSSVQAENGAPFINPAEILTQTHTAKEFIQQQLKKPLGPDHINTLEQLKIELEHITHGHMAFNMANVTQLSPEIVLQQQIDQQSQQLEHQQLEYRQLEQHQQQLEQQLQQQQQIIYANGNHVRIMLTLPETHLRCVLLLHECSKCWVSFPTADAAAHHATHIGCSSLKCNGIVHRPNCQSTAIPAEQCRKCI